MQLNQSEESSPPSRARQSSAALKLTWFVRLISAVAGATLLGLLIVARTLEPDPQGFGTHQQLGLPACTSVVLFDALCPACGMTTSWAWFTRGALVRSARANAGGLMLAIIALVYVPASCYFTVVGRATKHAWFSMTLAIGLLAALGVAIVQWLSAVVLAA